MPHTPGAKIVGVNCNAYQLERARQYANEAGIAKQVDFLECDFLNVNAPDETFDAVYSIEATCCAPDKVSIYGEGYRLLKPGGRFAAYEYCMTDKYDMENPTHRQLKKDMALGGGLLVIDDAETVINALRMVGFEALATRDLAISEGPSIPWYQPLVGAGPSLASFRSLQCWTQAYPSHANGPGGATDSAQGNGRRSGHAESVRGGNGGGGTAGDFHADVLCSGPETGLMHLAAQPSHYLKPRLLLPS